MSGLLLLQVGRRVVGQVVRRGVGAGRRGQKAPVGRELLQVRRRWSLGARLPHQQQARSGQARGGGISSAGLREGLRPAEHPHGALGAELGPQVLQVRLVRLLQVVQPDAGPGRRHGFRAAGWHVQGRLRRRQRHVLHLRARGPLVERLPQQGQGQARLLRGRFQWIRRRRAQDVGRRRRRRQLLQVRPERPLVEGLPEREQRWRVPLALLDAAPRTGP
mmetsp:Transcript_3962/g.12164  ORF Transcript_3962/g.12164 Transcript_3962/m.12164 type:complete len:219 (-) Transcript_3962:25-681(-)